MLPTPSGHLGARGAHRAVVRDPTAATSGWRARRGTFAPASIGDRRECALQRVSQGQGLAGGDRGLGAGRAQAWREYRPDPRLPAWSRDASLSAGTSGAVGKPPPLTSHCGAADGPRHAAADASPTRKRRPCHLIADDLCALSFQSIGIPPVGDDALTTGEGNCGGATPPTWVRLPILIVRPRQALISQYSIARRAEPAQSEQADPRSVADARAPGRNRRGP